MNKLILIISSFLFLSSVDAQTYSIQDLEASFLQRSYLLIANKYNIDKADAEIVQEKLWNNPTLHIGEVNLWTNAGSEQMAYLFGRYGQTQQFAVELEQLVETAGKRRKRVHIKMLEKNSALYNYEEVMRELKKELRHRINSLYRIQKEEKELKSIVTLFEQLYEQYERQSVQQNISKADYYRVQAALIGLQKELVKIESERQEELTKVKILTQIPDLSVEQISFPEESLILSMTLPSDLTGLATERNIDLKRQKNEMQIAEKQLELAYAQRKPDLTFQVNYDRGGNIMQDFVGIGVSMDLPILNTNKGNIKVAKYGVEQEQAELLALQIELENTIIRLRNQLIKYESALERWSKDQLSEQVNMIANYRKYLQSKQVTLMEFIDFVQAYQEAQSAYLALLENYRNTYEELQYVVGTDF